MGYNINLPDNLYTRGAVVFNTPQYFNYIQQAKARREAKQQAVDSYYQDLSKNLTSSGMASNDVPDFMEKVNKWRDYVVQNRQIISNPNNPNYAKVAQQGGYLYNDAMQHSSISKDKVKQLADARQFIKPNDPLTDASVLMLHNATLPVAKGYQPIDYSLLQYQPDEQKPATAEDLIKYENLVKNGLQMSEGQPSVSIDPATKSKIVTTKSFYEPQAINAMARRSEMLYQTDPKFHTLVNNMSQDPANYAALNDAYKRIYKKDIDIEHPEQFATALLLGQTEKTNTQPYTYAPPTINVNAGNGKAVNNVYQRVKNAVTNTQNQTGVGIMPLSDLDSDARELIINSLNAGRKTKLKPEKLRVLIANNGDIRVIKGNSPDLIGAFSPDEFNLRANSTAQDQQILNAQQQNSNAPAKNKTYKGLDKNGNPIFE